MKKSLVALAALAATSAFAQSTVTLSGLVDAGYQSVDFKGQKNSGIANNGRSTSTIQLSGTEDLGNGLKANFKLNSDFDPTRGQFNTGTTGAAAGANTSSSWLNSEKYVGLTGGFGDVKVGVVNNQSLNTFGVGANFGTAIGSGFRYVTKTDVLGVVGATTAPTNGVIGAADASAVRFDKSVTYTTPSFNGFSATANFVKKNTGADTNTFSTTQHAYDLAGVNEYAANYSNGPLNVSFTTQVQNSIGVTGATQQYKSKLDTFGANYTIGAFKLFALNQAAKADTAAAVSVYKTSYTSFGADYVIGDITLKAQTGTLNNKLHAAANNGKTGILAFGADYALSKRTTAYVRSESLKDDGNNIFEPTGLTGGTGTTIKRLGAGVVHTF